MKPKLSISGAAGRMGTTVASIAIDAGRFDIIAAIERPGHSELGKDLGLLVGKEPIGVKLAEDFPKQTDVVIDFSEPEATDKTVDYCQASGAALVMGTTGLSDKQQDKIRAASAKIPVVYGTNMSVGMNVLFNLAAKVAPMLGDEYDIEIIEQHHRFKKDAPSGSALTLARNICEATERDFPESIVYSRHGKEALREKGTIGIHAVRAGDITGIHSVIFSTIGETVTLSHAAHSRAGFARGALRAAGWLIGKEPGLYSMADVLGIR